jgi:hypothetical protein
MERQQNVGQKNNIQRFALAERGEKFFHDIIIANKLIFSTKKATRGVAWNCLLSPTLLLPEI